MERGSSDTTLARPAFCVRWITWMNAIEAQFADVASPRSGRDLPEFVEPSLIASDVRQTSERFSSNRIRLLIPLSPIFRTRSRCR